MNKWFEIWWINRCLYEIKGTLKGFDQTVNIILDDSHEVVYSVTQWVDQVALGGDNMWDSFADISILSNFLKDRIQDFSLFLSLCILSILDFCFVLIVIKLFIVCLWVAFDMIVLKPILIINVFKTCTNIVWTNAWIIYFCQCCHRRDWWRTR
jgi:small nuclear ribonucleoprotein (snRNP)-like protein